MFFLCFFCLTPPPPPPLRLECSRIRKTTSFLMPHRRRNTKICIHGASWMEPKWGKCWKLPIFEGKLRVFIRLLFSIFNYRLPFSILMWYISSPYHLNFPKKLVLKLGSHLPKTISTSVKALENNEKCF